MFPTLKKLLDSFLPMGLNGFDIVIYKDGQCVWRYQNGFSDAALKTPYTGQERYNIYSCSKVITVTAAMQLLEKKLFSLDDPLYLYMPEFEKMTVCAGDEVVPAKNFIRIRDLFCMTAGFTYNKDTVNIQQGIKDTNGRAPTREMMKYLAKDPLAFEPGTQWRYSLCHDVLAALVEVVSGELFEDYVQKHIFQPLGMTHSTFVLPEAERPALAAQYRFNNECKEAVDCGRGNSYMFGSEYASGGAGCVTTVDDYIRFAEALRVGDVILGKDATRLMTTDQLSDATRPFYSMKERHGYGLGVRCPKEGGWRQDFGWGGAAGAYLAIHPAENMSIFYAQHMLNSPHQPLRNFFIDCMYKDLHPDKALPDSAMADAGLTY